MHHTQIQLVLTLINTVVKVIEKLLLCNFDGFPAILTWSSTNSLCKNNFVSPYHVISHHIIISYHIISYHIISYHIISYHIISYHIISYHIISMYYLHPSTTTLSITNSNYTKFLPYLYLR